MKTCPNCNTMMDDNVKVCPNCGAGEVQPGAVEAPVYESAPVAAKAPAKKAGKGLGIAALILAIIGIYCIMSAVATTAGTYIFLHGEKIIEDLGLGDTEEYQEVIDQLGEMIAELEAQGMDEATFEIAVRIMGAFMVLFFAVFSILAFIFALVSRKKGYKNGITMAALVMSIIGLVAYVVCIIANIVA